MPTVPELHVEIESRENHFALDGESCAVCTGPVVGLEVAVLIDGDGERHGHVCALCVEAGDAAGHARLRTRAASLRLQAVSIEDLAKSFRAGGIFDEATICTRCVGEEAAP